MLKTKYYISGFKCTYLRKYKSYIFTKHLSYLCEESTSLLAFSTLISNVYYCNILLSQCVSVMSQSSGDS